MQPLRYFREYFGAENLGDITWAEAVNSQALLRQALADKTRMVIDADITRSPDSTVVCAHWPDLTSDLSYVDLLAAMGTTMQGLKLDFKDADIVVSCLEQLREAGLSQPVVLNADVLSLPGAPAPDFNAAAFIAQCQTLYPEGLLSVGWRTEDDPAHPYKANDIDAMLQLTTDVSPVVFPVVFPVRASLLPYSWPAIKELLADPRHSLLVWNSGKVSLALRKWLYGHVGQERAFYEVAYL